MADHDETTEIKTHTGLVLHVRAARSDDEAALAEFFRHVTPDDLRFRFLGGIREVSHDRLADMLKVDHGRTESFLALPPEGTPIIGTAMLVCEGGRERAEVAISVRSDYKHKGVGWELLRYVSSHASANGVKVLESLESRENREAIELERQQGFTASPYPDDPTLVLIRKSLKAD